MSKAKAETLKIIEEAMPAYAERFPEACACGACPHALRQTRTTPVIVSPHASFNDETLLHLSCSYRCGVCGHAHDRTMLVKQGD